MKTITYTILLILLALLIGCQHNQDLGMDEPWPRPYKYKYNALNQIEYYTLNGEYIETQKTKF